MPNFSIPLSGLTAESTALSAIANNLSNQNTVGYKDTTVQFSDLFYQELGSTGSGDPIQVGAGTEVGSMPALFSQGSVEATGVPTDVAIQGSGFFVVQNGDGTLNYTRAGDFSVDANNNLVTSNGQSVLGYPAVNGVVNNGAAIAPLQLGAGTLSPPTATANVQLTTNLNGAANVGDTFSTPVNVYDSLGASHTLTFNFTNTGPGAWTYNVTIPAADVGQTGNPVTLSTGNLTFDSSGNLLTPAANVTGGATTGVQMERRI
jgi:flagellar hook protein FlgE